MPWQFDRVAGPFEFTEGPAWDGEAVLFSDIPNDRVLRHDPVTGGCEVHRTNAPGVNGLKFGPEGALYACEGDAHRVVRYDGEETVVLADAYDGARLNAPNDLAFDGRGRLWFTDPDYADREGLELGHESVYRLDPADDWTITRVTDDTTKPNGVLVSPDDATLYVAQSDYDEDAPTELRAYPIRDDGSLGAYQVLHDFHPHRGIDGMCFDADGNVVATAGWEEGGPGPAVYVFAPGGRVLATHPFPVDMPTNCAFGGTDLSTLYVTAGDGGLYRAETDRLGLLGAP